MQVSEESIYSMQVSEEIIYTKGSSLPQIQLKCLASYLDPNTQIFCTPKQIRVTPLASEEYLLR